MSQTIGFVGVGRMGANMARRLKDCGYTISAVNDVNKEAAAALAEELGATHAENLAAVTAASDIIFTVITNDAAMRSIFLDGDDNLLATDASGKTFINCATLTPQVHIDLETAAAAISAKTIEGCMASSIPQARSGELFLMIGGQEADFNTNKPLLDDLSKALH